MKSKALTYGLLIVVAFIWYKVFFRIKDNIVGKDEVILAPNNPNKGFKIDKRDTFKLQANYRDPFGAKPILTAIEVSEVLPEAPKEIVKKIVRWPSLHYYGMVRKSDSKNPLGIVQIDGMMFTLRKGESTFDDIQIKGIGRDSVVIRYQKETRVFWRE